jgi:hypothetical protein
LLIGLSGVAIVAIALTFALSQSGGEASATGNAGPLESMVSSRTGLTTDTLHKIESAGLAAIADRASASGVLTTTQADNLRALDVSPILEQAFAGLAQQTNTTEADLFNSLASGQSLAQVAEAHNVDRDALKANLRQLAQGSLQSLENASVLSQSQIDMVQSLLTDANLGHLIDLSLPPHLASQP